MEDPEPMANLLLFFEVVLLPPIIYENGLIENQSVRLFTRLGTISLAALMTVAFSTSIFSLLIRILQIENFL